MRERYRGAWRCFLIGIVLTTSTAAAEEPPALKLATTTSVENSGLLTYLLPEFEAQCACRVHVIPVGSGKAMALGQAGDVDVLISHAPDDERAFVAAGDGIARESFMWNSFVIVGPEDDPARIQEHHNVSEAFAKIAASQSRFISRGDESGTHKKEMQLWNTVESSDPETFGDWYIRSGVGMGQALVMANELNAYTLSDIGTFLHFQEQIDIVILKQNAPPLINTYSVMRINPEKHSHVNATLAKGFRDWLFSPETQRRINAYTIRGAVLFTAINAAD